MSASPLKADIDGKATGSLEGLMLTQGSPLARPAAAPSPISLPVAVVPRTIVEQTATLLLPNKVARDETRQDENPSPI
jgi:hypothetical protein